MNNALSKIVLINLSWRVDMLAPSWPLRLTTRPSHKPIHAPRELLTKSQRDIFFLENRSEGFLRRLRPAGGEVVSKRLTAGFRERTYFLMGVMPVFFQHLLQPGREGHG